MKNNPYSLVFGKQPVQLLSRYPDSTNIIEDFESENSNHIFIIAGVRGSGKTVAMTTIAKHFKSNDEWIVINLSPEVDLLQSMAAELGESKQLKKHLQFESLSISLAGIKIETKKVAPITDVKIAITKLLEIAKKANLKVLITIDEIVNSDNIRVFSSVFQILLREDLPVFLLMTGLYENVHSLQNQKTLTFLYRAPRIEMKPINIGNIARNYKSTFEISEDVARSMAKITNGYPYAFQLLGYLTWDNGGNYMEIIDTFKSYLQDYVYDKIWTEMSSKDQDVSYAIAKSSSGATEEIKAILNCKQNEFNPYRKRLKDKGLINVERRGYMSFMLPYFDEFVIERYELERD